MIVLIRFNFISYLKIINKSKKTSPFIFYKNIILVLLIFLVFLKKLKPLNYHIKFNSQAKIIKTNQLLYSPNKNKIAQKHFKKKTYKYVLFLKVNFVKNLNFIKKNLLYTFLKFKDINSNILFLNKISIQFNNVKLYNTYNEI